MSVIEDLKVLNEAVDEKKRLEAIEAWEKEKRAKALTELKGLSKETKYYFQNKIRNPLQVMIIYAGDKNCEGIKDEIFALKDELRRMGL